MRAIVTGAAGFVGSHLCEALLEAGWSVTGLDLMTPFYDPAIKSANLARARAHHRFSRLEMDVATCDWQALGDHTDVVFHLAAQAGVRTSWGDAFADHVHHNLLVTQRLLEGLRHCRTMPRLVFASSSSVYGNAESLPTPETAKLIPTSPYGITKQAAEHLGFLYQDQFGLPFTALRYFTIYGPRQRPDMAFHRFFRALKQGRPIDVNGDGKQRRDFTYVSDAVAATIKAATADGAIGEAINIGGGQSVPLNDVIAQIAVITGIQSPRRRQPEQAGDARHTGADIRKAQRLLDYHPRVNLTEGLAAMWEWYDALPDGIAPAS